MKDTRIEPSTDLSSGSSDTKPLMVKGMRMEVAKAEVTTLKRLLDLALKFVELDISGRKPPEGWTKEGMDKYAVASMLKESVDRFVGESLQVSDPEKWKNSR